MLHSRILNLVKARLHVLRLAVIGGVIGGLLSPFAAAPLHAQFTFSGLYEFNCNTGGCLPFDNGQLAQGSDGNLYGTTSTGGVHDFGTIFQMTTSGTDNDLWAFDGLSGEGPQGGLTSASDGNFYGAAIMGGASNNGTVFLFAPPSFVSVLHSFNGTDGSAPIPPPIQGKDANLYGVTNSGTTYTVILPAGTFKQLPSNASGSSGPLFLASDGNLYCTTLSSGTFGKGTVFRMTTPGGAIQTIYNFSGSDGEFPEGGLTQGSDGFLYGTTGAGGANGSGEVFKMTLAGKIKILHSFDAFSGSTNNDGGGPGAGLLAASDGNLYGVNTQGGANGVGTIFKITINGVFTKLFDFTGNGGAVPGSFPIAALMQHTNGSLYGIAGQGGANGDGTFFSLTEPHLIQILTVEGPIFVRPGGPVQILGNNLTHVISVTFGSVQATFRIGSDTHLTATVPTSALDGAIVATFDTGLQIHTQSAVHILPLINSLDPLSGTVGTQVNISGGGFSGTKKVAFGGVKSTSVTVVSPSLIQATVPAGAKTGKVAVTTQNGTAVSKQTFTVN